ncbi:hypothetical protein K505DRAFT_111298 [Melanomma pulvis-pyrius CBS 109.77]|uniref:Uncharacterized protein n=1 Tax=Melanomma pulvis-pyrius CBS 109.77 TaxID=1314802 RepID=A0A6A6WW44_9PLEO|nr:hypothetical protein K505DRAFT_111298 [Melanomma pulvis-pyrius CBS 109.77]
MRDARASGPVDGRRDSGEALRGVCRRRSNLLRSCRGGGLGGASASRASCVQRRWRPPQHLVIGAPPAAGSAASSKSSRGVVLSCVPEMRSLNPHTFTLRTASGRLVGPSCRVLVQHHSRATPCPSSLHPHPLALSIEARISPISQSPSPALCLASRCLCCDVRLLRPLPSLRRPEGQPIAARWLRTTRSGGERRSAKKTLGLLAVSGLQGSSHRQQPSPDGLQVPQCRSAQAEGSHATLHYQRCRFR